MNLNDPFTSPFAEVDARRHNFPKPTPPAEEPARPTTHTGKAPSCWEVAGKITRPAVDETAPARNKFGDPIK